MRLVARLLRRFVQRGRLCVYDWDGQRHEFSGGGAGPTVAIRLHDRALGLELFVNPELRAAEAYMDGRLTLEDGSTLFDLMHLFWINRATLADYPTQRLIRGFWALMRPLHQGNSVALAAGRVRHYYDISSDLYRLFLDENLNYSCAYFKSPTDTLEAAQEAKHLHAIAKLGLAPGMHVLEIGGGWGDFAVHLARAGAQVVSLNVSPEQVRMAEARVAAEGLASKVRFVIADYRDFSGKFDRVVSVGMMEHVGARYLPAYFSAVKRFLKPDGVAFVHSIGRMTEPGITAPFLRRYIFPGGYVPALSETLASVERVGLWCDDVEVLRLHYAYTLRHWRERFMARREEARRLYDERFCRMWELYLTAVETGFLFGRHMVFQVLLSRSRDAVPITRDFMFEAERRARAEPAEPALAPGKERMDA